MRRGRGRGLPLRSERRGTAVNERSLEIEASGLENWKPPGTVDRSRIHGANLTSVPPLPLRRPPSRRTPRLTTRAATSAIESSRVIECHTLQRYRSSAPLESARLKLRPNTTESSRAHNTTRHRRRADSDRASEAAAMRISNEPVSPRKLSFSVRPRKLGPPLPTLSTAAQMTRTHKRYRPPARAPHARPKAESSPAQARASTLN